MAYDVSERSALAVGSRRHFRSNDRYPLHCGSQGKVGLVRDILADITTSLVGSTTVPEVMIGISSGDFDLWSLPSGTTASGGYAVGRHRASQELLPGNPPALRRTSPARDSRRRPSDLHRHCRRFLTALLYRRDAIPKWEAGLSPTCSWASMRPTAEFSCPAKRRARTW